MNIAIIPARHGSKSILNKNLQKVGTKSIVDRTIQGAIESGIFQQIFLTTDIPCLLEEYGPSKTVMTRSRPKNLCLDDSLMTEVVIDVLNTFGIWPEARVWLLQPTALFRQVGDFKFIQSIFQKPNPPRSVISVFEVGANHPNRMYTIKNDKLYPIQFTSFKNKQDLPVMYQRSGHFYVTSARDFRDFQGFHVKPCKAYVMERLRGMFNVDEPLDLRLAQLVYKEGLCR